MLRPQALNRYLSMSLTSLAIFLFIPLSTMAAKSLCPNMINEIETVYQAQHQEQADAEKTMLKRMREDPAQYYFELQAKIKEDMKPGQDDFRFAPYKPIVERIAKDLKQRQSRKYGDKYYRQLAEVRREALNLLRSGDPKYKKTIHFIMYKYLPLLDSIFGERHPELMANDFHKRNAEIQLNYFLTRAPDLLLVFSFEGESIDTDFFNQARPAPVQLIGIDLRGLDDQGETPYADKFPMKISEFAWHDVGHVDFMAFRDLDYIYGADKPIERIVWEWEATRLRIKGAHGPVRKSDPDLGDAIEMLLSEILHERGFQYSLTVLKQELEIPKWVEVILRKNSFKFYEKITHNPRLFNRLEEARLYLNSAVRLFKEEDQIKWMASTNSSQVPAKITYVPALGYAKSFLDHIEVTDPEVEATVYVKPENSSPDHFEIIEMVSAQVSPTRHSPFTAEVKLKMEKVLWLKKKMPELKIKSIVVNKDKTIDVLYSSGRRVSLDQFVLSGKIPAEVPALPNLTLFKMDQVLGTEDRKERISFTIREKVQILSGKTQLENVNAPGYRQITVTTFDGKKTKYNLVDVRIDPLYKHHVE